MNTRYSDVFNRKKQDAMKNFFLDELGPIGHMEKYKKGATICKDISKDMFVVKNGRISVFLNEQGGEEQLVYTLVAGEVLGEFEVLSGVGQNYILHFIEEGELYRVSKKEVEKFLKKNPEMYIYFTHSMTRKYNLALYQVSFNKFYSVEERVLEFLIRLSRSIYPDMEENLEIHGYTHEDIGNNLNISRVGVTNILKRLKDLGLVEIKRKLIVIKSLKHLEEYRNKIR